MLIHCFCRRVIFSSFLIHFDVDELPLTTRFYFPRTLFPSRKPYPLIISPRRSPFFHLLLPRQSMPFLPRHMMKSNARPGQDILRRPAGPQHYFSAPLRICVFPPSFPLRSSRPQTRTLSSSRITLAFFSFCNALTNVWFMSRPSCTVLFDPPARVRAEHSQKSDRGFKLSSPFPLATVLFSLAQENRAGQGRIYFRFVLIGFCLLLPKGAPGRCAALFGQVLLIASLRFAKCQKAEGPISPTTTAGGSF